MRLIVKKVIQNKEGISFLDVMVGLVALLGFTSMMVTTTNFMAQNQQQVRERTQFKQVVHNTVMENYTVDTWSDLEAEEIPTDDGLVDVKYNYLGIQPDYLTERLSVVFKLNDREETYRLERSVVRDE